jgi:hypothetical protein
VPAFFVIRHIGVQYNGFSSQNERERVEKSQEKEIKS